MKKIAIVCDSSASLSPEKITELGVYVAPLTIIHNNKEYQDQIDISHDDVHNLLRQKETIKTSQPNLGTLIDLFTKIKATGYDHIFVVALSSHLSGTHTSFANAIVETQLTNVTLIDTQTLAGPVQQAIALIRKLNDQDHAIETITQAVKDMMDHTVSYAYPQHLQQLKLSGRISKRAAALASLLKIKIVLSLENKAVAFDKLATPRTENKVYEIITNELIKHGVKTGTHKLFFLHSENVAGLLKLRDFIFAQLGEFDSEIIILPAAIATHAGLGTIAIQWVTNP